MQLFQLAGLVNKPANSTLRTTMAEASRLALKHSQERQKAGV